MESLAVFLEPHKDSIASSASIVTYFHQLSGVVICNTIRRQKSTKGHSVLPFLAGAVISALAIRFGIILDDAPTVQVNSIGTALNIVYILFYFWYTKDVKDRALAWAQIGYGGAFVAAVYAYTLVENPENLPFRYGLIFTAVLFYFVGSPLLALFKHFSVHKSRYRYSSDSYNTLGVFTADMFVYMVIMCTLTLCCEHRVSMALPEFIRKKSTEGLPFPIILTGTIISFLWLLYGIVTREQFVILQNLVVFTMSIVQLSLFAIFPSTSSSPARSKKNSNYKKKN